MVDNQEIPAGRQAVEDNISEQDRLNLYTYVDILHKEGSALLTRYLPQAQPHESAKMLVGVVPQYVGKFKDQHYLALERPAELDPMVQTLRSLNQDAESDYEKIKRWGELEQKRFELIAAKAAEGQITEADFEEIDRIMKLEEEAMDKEQIPVEKTEKEPSDWQNPDKLLQGPSQYSDETWQGLCSSVHEQIHQKQAETNPAAFPVLDSPELADLDPNSTERGQVYNQLFEAHKAYTRSQNNRSLFYPVIEGLAVLGTYYVMGKYAEDLEKSGETESAQRLQKVRRNLLHSEIVGSRREARAGRNNYDPYYTEGFGIMRKLFKHFGAENIPNILIGVDLAACRQIENGSPKYQQIMDNPTLLPGLALAA